MSLWQRIRRWLRPGSEPPLPSQPDPAPSAPDPDAVEARLRAIVETVIRLGYQGDIKSGHIWTEGSLPRPARQDDERD